MILNLAIWFAIHTIFRAVEPFHAGPLRFDVPVPSSIDPWTLLLSAAAIVAMLRFKTGTIPTLATTSAAGLALYMAGVTQ